MNTLAADFILLMHAGFVLFVVLSLPLIILGKYLGWIWVHNFRFRLIHLIAIVLVTLQAWFGMICPLTSLEMALIENTGETTYTGSFIAHWVSAWLYYDLPLWLFTLGYTVFCGLITGCWFWAKPQKK